MNTKLEAQDHLGKLRNRCLLPHKPLTRSEWMEENKDKSDYYRFKFAPPPRDCAPRQKNGTPTTN